MGCEFDSVMNYFKLYDFEGDLIEEIDFNVMMVWNYSYLMTIGVDHTHRLHEFGLAVND